MKPAFTQEPALAASNLQGCLNEQAEAQGNPGGSGRRVRASAAMLSLALSVGASGTVLSQAEGAIASESATLAARSRVSAPRTLPSIGSDRPRGASAAYHTVREGETLWNIAQLHQVKVADIKAANGIADDQVIQVGQVLKVPSVQRDAAVVLQPPSTVPVEEALAAPMSSVPQQPSPERVVAGSALSSDALSPQKSVTPLQDQRDKLTDPSLPNLSVSENSLAAGSAPSQAGSTATGLLTQLPAPLNAELPDGFGIASLPREQSVSLLSSDQAPVTAVESTVGKQSYQVQVGDTLWSIAAHHGVSVDDLRQANGISNPSLIFPGDALVIPLGVAKEHPAETAIAPVIRLPIQVAALGTEGLQAAFRSPSAAATQSSLGAGSVLPSEQLALEPEGGASDTEDSPEATDPYVAGLLARLNTIPQAVEVVPPAESSTREEAVDLLAQQPVQFASDSTTAERASLPSVNPVDPQFTPASEDVRNEGSAFTPADLLAAAPLGSEVYAPIVEDPTGRVVSPSMPVLPEGSELLPEAPSRFHGYIWPSTGVLTSGYGQRWGRMHRGIDIAGPVGTPIVAAAPGIVVRSGWNSGGYGNLVDIRHPDGSMTRYAHNSRLLVREGEQVRQGQQIAEMGSTGYSTGPHLHFEVHLPNQGAVNPIAQLPSR